jgi:2-dehydro-3-deoxyphosphogluconate aldolase / (4S)-4-hydroxy-2-oxoglutarate aldolase
MRACYEAGYNYFEFTARTENALQVFEEIQAYAQENFAGLILGAGTIKSVRQLKQFSKAGAKFFVSPFFSEALHGYVHAEGKIWIPGCATPGEIGRAEEVGYSLVKIFPATLLGGPAYIKAMRELFPTLRFIATGGVKPTRAEVSNWIDNGCSAVGIGGQLFQESNSPAIIVETLKSLQ